MYIAKKRVNPSTCPKSLLNLLEYLLARQFFVHDPAFVLHVAASAIYRVTWSRSYFYLLLAEKNVEYSDVDILVQSMDEVQLGKLLVEIARRVSLQAG